MPILVNVVPSSVSIISPERLALSFSRESETRALVICAVSGIHCWPRYLLMSRQMPSCIRHPPCNLRARRAPESNRSHLYMSGSSAKSDRHTKHLSLFLTKTVKFILSTTPPSVTNYLASSNFCWAWQLYERPSQSPAPLARNCVYAVPIPPTASY